MSSPAGTVTPGLLIEWGSSALADGGATHLRGLAAIWPGASMAGRVVTASVEAGDNLAVQVAVAEAPPGSIVVVEVTPGEREAGIWGEIITVAALQRGIGGVVVDGPVRDVAPTAALGFPVFATGTCPVGPTKLGGSVGGAVTVAGVGVSPGDWVVGDADGVVVLGSDGFDDIVAAAGAKVGREPRIIDQLRSGRTTIELLELDIGPVRRA